MNALKEEPPVALASTAVVEVVAMAEVAAMAEVVAMEVVAMEVVVGVVMAAFAAVAVDSAEDSIVMPLPLLLSPGTWLTVALRLIWPGILRKMWSFPAAARGPDFRRSR